MSLLLTTKDQEEQSFYFQSARLAHGLMSILAGCSMIILPIRFAEFFKCSDFVILYLFIHGSLLVFCGAFLVNRHFVDRISRHPQRWLFHFVITACSLFGFIINIGDALAFADCTWTPLLFLIMSCFVWLHGLVRWQLSHR